MTLQRARIAADVDRGLDAGALVVPRLFAPEEMGWIAEEARALGARLSGRPRGAVPIVSRDEGPEGTLFDVDLHEEPFRRLLAHPRLLTHVHALLPEPLYVHRTRLIGETAPADGIWRSDAASWEGNGAQRLVTAVVALRAAASPVLAVRPFGAREAGEMALALPTGSVAFLDAAASYTVHAGALFLITYNALASQPVADWAGLGGARSRPLVSALSDDCLWPPAFACAG
jgi:hypothetical protein